MEVTKRGRKILHPLCKDQIFVIGKCVYTSTWTWFYSILTRVNHHCIIQFVIMPQTVLTLCQLWHSVYCATFQSATPKAIKALSLHSINLNHLSTVFLTCSIFSLGIVTKRPELLLLNKTARIALGNFLSSGEQMLGDQAPSGLFTQTIHWGRVICTVWQEKEWGLAFLIMVTYLEISIQIHADWWFYCLLITHWIEKKWYSRAISARHVLKSSEVVRQMKVPRRDANVHQHCRQGRADRGMVHAATHSEFHMLLVLLQTDTPEDKE